MPSAPLPVPDPASMTTVVPAAARTEGSWAGAASVVRRPDGQWFLAVRMRRPVDEGRGVGVVLATSADGIAWTEVATISRDRLGAASLERPALVDVGDGRWRIYLSCATSGSKHWWVEALTADSFAGLPDGRRDVVHAGSADVGVKDPVVERHGEGWRMWLCCHPLDVPGAEDRMTTRLLHSDDGLAWTDEGEVLAGRPDAWDARGARVTAVLTRTPLTLLYDGRPDAASNWHETTGATRADGTRVDGIRLRSPYSDRSFRYATVVSLPDGSSRWYAEMAAPDGAHDLVTALVPAAPEPSTTGEHP